jgi:uncharacterized membrane protein YbaN (DUF454 family)
VTPLKFFLNLVGMLALALGIAGLFLPLVPTTPFLLLASACFMRGSERMHRWLLGNRVFGKAIRDYEEKRAVPRRAKIAGIFVLWASMSISIYLMPPVWLKLMLVAIGAAVTIYLWRLRTLEPGE